MRFRLARCSFVAAPSEKSELLSASALPTVALKNSLVEHLQLQGCKLNGCRRPNYFRRFVVETFQMQRAKATISDT